MARNILAVAREIALLADRDGVTLPPLESVALHEEPSQASDKFVTRVVSGDAGPMKHVSERWLAAHSSSLASPDDLAQALVDLAAAHPYVEWTLRVVRLTNDHTLLLLTAGDGAPPLPAGEMAASSGEFVWVSTGGVANCVSVSASGSVRFDEELSRALTEVSARTTAILPSEWDVVVSWRRGKTP